ncbi:hypothetical protein B0I35DRAFT_358094 [Stachybotrys elegans]|uniref:Cell division cycle protein 123 n=1 Tax=Stachybotrys elegans TaxID=80388 RepID=A0A8K0SIF9_9HYPO|nr:hypothetical protein B0I35DRAFT_358094 [Stachybotrys elegans]
MRLKIIDFQDVQADLDTGLPTNFNTCFHTAAEAPDLPVPTNAPYSFERWLPLILSTRGLPPSAVQTVVFSPAQIRVLLHAAEASIHTRVLNRSYAEDLEEEVHPALAALAFPPEGLFMRTADCSPKDGAHATPGVLALHSAADAVLRATTSMRTWSTLNNAMNRGARELKAFFLPFDAAMRAEREYRVFCAPGTLRVTAVSQYRWHKPWIFAGREDQERRDVADKIMRGVEEIHGRIVRELGAEETDGLARAQGFSFDVLFDEGTESCSLIELNTFGVRSACGSCLFQWVKDRELLYGAAEEVEFRVAM